MEAIGLEDIGQLPADSVADAISALPGVAGARTDDGEISGLSVRGATDLTLGLLNGREQVTVAGTRNVEFNLYPTNVATSVQVFKTQKAELTEGGLSGMVNINTIRPLDFDSRQIVFSADLVDYGLADDVLGADELGGAASVTYIDQLNAQTGVSLAYAYTLETRGFNGAVTPLNWATFAGGFGPPPDIDGDGQVGDEVIPQGFNLSQRGGDVERHSVFGAYEYDDGPLDVYVDALWSERTSDFLASGFNLLGTLNSGGTLVNPIFNTRDLGAGVIQDEVVSGTITIPGSNNVGFGSGGSSGFFQYEDTRDEIFSAGVNVSYDLDDWTLTGDLGYSSAKRKRQIDAATVNLAPTGGFGGPTLTLTFDALGDDPALSTAEDLTDPTIFVPRQLDFFSRKFDDSLVSARFDAERAIDFGGEGFNWSAMKFGIRFSSREKDFIQEANRESTALIPDDPTLPLDASFVIGIDRPDNGPAYAIFDPNALRARFAGMIPEPGETANPAAPFLPINSLLESTGTVEEQSVSAYGQFDFEGAMGQTPFSGNIGLRYVTTEVEAPGFATPARNTAPAVAINPEHDYSELLPSANIAYDFTSQVKFRLGLAKVLSRPPVDDLVSSQQLFISGFGASGNAGNPMLDPTVAWQTSASLEWYPDDATSFVIAAHYSDLETYIGTQFVNLVVQTQTGNVNVNLQSLGNGEGGYIQGVELAGTTTFGFIDPALDGFGVSTNYAWTDSNVLPVGVGGFGTTAQGVALTGLSEHVANAQIFYATGPFEARFGLDYRSSYIEPDVFGNFITVDDVTLGSFQASYNVTDNTRVSVFGANIFDTQRRKYNDNVPARTEFNSGYGSNYGIRLFSKF